MCAKRSSGYFGILRGISPFTAKNNAQGSRRNGDLNAVLVLAWGEIRTGGAFTSKGCTRRLLADGVLQDERLEDGGNLLLLASRQPRSRFEELPHLSGRTVAAVPRWLLAD